MNPISPWNLTGHHDATRKKSVDPQSELNSFRKYGHIYWFRTREPAAVSRSATSGFQKLGQIIGADLRSAPLRWENADPIPFAAL
jgi:hypothetical protein